MLVASRNSSTTDKPKKEQAPVILTKDATMVDGVKLISDSMDVCEQFLVSFCSAYFFSLWFCFEFPSFALKRVPSWGGGPRGHRISFCRYLMQLSLGWHRIVHLAAGQQQRLHSPLSCAKVTQSGVSRKGNEDCEVPHLNNRLNWLPNAFHSSWLILFSRLTLSTCREQCAYFIRICCVFYLFY